MNNSTIQKKRTGLFGRVLCPVFCLMFILSLPSAWAGDSSIESLQKTGNAFASVAKKVSPAVVFIQIEQNVQNQPSKEFYFPFGEDSPFGDDFFQRFGTPVPQQPRQFRQAPRRRQRVMGQGSGFIISADGYILTNNHVVGNADKVTVRLEDGRDFTAEIIGADSHSDVAVIKIEAENLPVLSLGDSDALEVGEWVIAVGNPFGLSHTLTAGIVSAKGRSSIGIADYENFIQTDAAINPGNSGGPLVNLAGQAVGMNTAIFSRSGGYMGIGFAIPINMATSIKDQLVKTGSVTRGYLGIAIQDLTPDLAKSFGLDKVKGVLVAQVTEGSPAEKAGLKQGDLIIKFDGKPVEKVGSFRNRVALKAPGSREKITVLRKGKNKTLSVTIGTLPESGLTASASRHSLKELGLTVQTLTGDLAARFGVQAQSGVVVTQVTSGSVAAMAGIKPGSVIKEVNRKRIENIDDFRQAMERTPEGESVLMLIMEGKYSRYVALKAR